MAPTSPSPFPRPAAKYKPRPQRLQRPPARAPAWRDGGKQGHVQSSPTPSQPLSNPSPTLPHLLPHPSIQGHGCLIPWANHSAVLELVFAAAAVATPPLPGFPGMASIRPTMSTPHSWMESYAGRALSGQGSACQTGPSLQIIMSSSGSRCSTGPAAAARGLVAHL